MVVEEVLHFVKSYILYVVEIPPDNRPFVRVCGESRVAQYVVEVAVWDIDASLLEFFNHDTFLHIERLPGESHVGHAVAFEPERGFDVLCGKNVVKVGEVARGPRIAFSSCFL